MFLTKKQTFSLITTTVLSIAVLLGVFSVFNLGNSSQVYAVEEKGFSVKRDCDNPDINAGNCEIVRYIKMFINALSAAAGIIIVIMLAVGGVQYSAARDNPQAVANARRHILNTLIALLLYIFGFAILQWLVPGGIL